ncbi:MAG TPA: aminotransferase class V-fold PLP-dependent enzyme, partial [Clostridia bacterium]|nr:aminotransferase class V-fold PLP-dependent enzyme [Clostridia bacterium]
MIYLDNAATTFPKPDIVWNTMNIYMREHGANPGRGGYEMAIAAGAVIQKTRDELALLINADDSMRISFTKNATEALNIGILGILRKGDHVVTTCMEHNSVLRPLHYLASKKIISVSYAKADKYGFVDSQTISKLIKRKTKMIICTFSSNVTGAVQPI